MWYDFLFFWRKKKEEEGYPYKFARVEVSPIAKSKGIKDSHNKIIKIFENGELIEEMPYTKELLNSIKEEHVPVYEEEFDEDEEFEFYPFEELGIIKYKK